MTILETCAAVVGSDFVLTDDETRRRAMSSWSPLWAKRGTDDNLPVCVVRPADTAEVAAVLRRASESQTPVFAAGGNSNTVNSVGANVDIRQAVALDLARLDSLSWDEESLLVTAGSGNTLQSVEEQLNRHDYTLGFYGGSARLATVGGAIAANAVGLFSGKQGRIVDLVAALEAVLPTGDIVRTHLAPGANAYYNVLSLFVGTEGRSGIITEATLLMRPVPEARAWAVFAYRTWNEAVDAARLVHRSDARPAATRVFDAQSARSLLEKAEAAPLPRNGALLLLGFEGEEITQTGPYQLAYAICERAGGEARSPLVGDVWFDNRESPGVWAANGRPGGVGDVLAVSAPWSRFKTAADGLLRAVSPLVTSVSCQLCHAQMHGAALEIAWEAEANPSTPEAAAQLYARVLERAHAACEASGAWPVHHYGIGQAHRDAFLQAIGPVAAQVLAVQ